MCLRKRFFSICLIVFVLCNLISLNVFASDDIDFSEDTKGSILIDYTYNSNPLDDVNFKVYYIASFISYEEIQTNDKFLDFDIEYTQLSSEEYWITTRDNLRNYISLNQIPADMEFVTDDFGKYKLEDLSLGLYYIEAENVVEETEIYFSEPIMIFVGQYDDEEDKWLYNFSVIAKISAMSYEPYPAITVTKVWENTDDEFVENQNIEVELYRNGILYDTVILSEENSWKYTWYEMDCTADWSVLEKITLQDYHVDYSHDIYDFTITNTYTGEEPSDEPEEEIPQTGSFANQIPIFAGIGLVLILVGFILKIIGKSHEN